MPRKARVDAAGALQHIIIRGIERRKIYRDDGDRSNFLDRLGSILLDTRTQCYAWAAVKALRKAGVRMKANQRILGDGDFVEALSVTGPTGNSA
jgi:hypothetical protein